MNSDRLTELLSGHWPELGGRLCGGCGASSLTDGTPLGDPEFFSLHLAGVIRFAFASNYLDPEDVGMVSEYRASADGQDGDWWYRHPEPQSFTEESA